MLANRRAARLEEIEAHGRPVEARTMLHKSKKVFDRKREKRAVIKSDDGFYYFGGIHKYAGWCIRNLSSIETCALISMQDGYRQKSKDVADNYTYVTRHKPKSDALKTFSNSLSF